MRASGMQRHPRWTPRIAVLLAVAALSGVPRLRAAAQTYAQRTQAAVDYILTHSEREDMIRMPMRDGIRLSATILFPKDRPRTNLPAVLIFIPYNTEGTIRSTLFSPFIRSFIENGYAVIIENVRGRYFSEGTFTYLVGSGKDGYDSIDWISKQSWSNGKVGTLGCSSSAEEQHKMNAMQHPAHAAAVPMGSGAGIGKVGAYNEMGNHYRGGAFQPWWFSWYYTITTYHPTWPAELTRDQMVRINKFWNMEPEISIPADLDHAVWTLPINKVMDTMGAMPSDMDDFVNRLPNDPKWKTTDFGHEGDRSGAPTLYVNSWYDLSIGPNLAMFEYQTKNAATELARDNIFMVIAPTLHCNQGRSESEHSVVGERDMGDARFDYTGLVQRWFDHWLKGVDNGVTREPKVRAYAMGTNEWRSYDTWPPKDVDLVPYYLDSDGSANSRLGNGRLTTTKPVKGGSDTFTYDPMHPVPSLGGQICCFSILPGGAFDQAGLEMRNDVLVYSTPPLTERVDVTGRIEVSLYLSSDVKDTDLTIKLVDVGPDGKAFNLDEGILRVRWREGWESPVFMVPGKVYKVDIPPLVTSNSFAVGHRIRVEVSSSSFPHFDRNLNTGGNNYDEKDGTIAHNVIHHAPGYLSRIVLPVVRSGSAAPSR